LALWADSHFRADLMFSLRARYKFR